MLIGIARHYHFGPLAYARQNHLHLIGRGVLHFICDHPTLFKRATSHECQGTYLNLLLLAETNDLLGAPTIVEHVEHGLHPGLHLLFERTREESMLLLHADRRTGNDDLFDLLFFDSPYCMFTGYHGLPCPTWTGGKNDGFPFVLEQFVIPNLGWIFGFDARTPLSSEITRRCHK